MRARGRVQVAALGLLAAFAAAGCELLFPGAFTPDGELQAPSPLATYTTGSATLGLSDGTRIRLDRLSKGPHLVTTFGSSVRWSNAAGWNLQVSGAGAGTPFGAGLLGSQAYIQLDRIVGVEHWRTYDPSRCIVDIDVADQTALKGSATCKGLEWTDALEVPFSDEPTEIGQPAFDAEITFEATR